MLSLARLELKVFLIAHHQSCQDESSYLPTYSMI